MQSTRECSVDGCAQPPKAKGLCGMHYARQRRTGGTGGATPTRGAGLDRSCTVDGCARQYKAHGLCIMHWQRVRSGSPLGGIEAQRSRYGSDEGCHAEGCTNRRSSGKWCGPHWQSVYRYGEPRPLHHKWATSWECLFCGAEVEKGGRYRKYCDARCERMWAAHGATKREPAECVRCGGGFDLMAITKGGQFKRADTKMCPECKRSRGTRHGYSPRAIVHIHGSTDCGICGLPVDLALAHPHRMSASIDHIIPYAHGGSNEPENLQLAHLHCNHVKSDRVMP